MAALVQKTAEFFLDGVTGGARSITGVTAGNLVACVVELCSQPNTSPTPAIPTPTGGWSVAIAPAGTTGIAAYRPNCAIFYKANASAGTHTATWATGAFPTDTYAEVSMLEVSGCDTSSPLDVVASATATGATSGNAGTTAATSALGGFLIAAGATGGEGSSFAGPSSGFTPIDGEPDASTHFTYASGYKVLSGSGAQSAAWSWSGAAAGFVGVQAAFKNASGGGGVTCDLAVTDTSDTLAATATVAISAALARTDTADTLSASATVAISAALGVTDSPDTLASAASALVVANAAATDADDTLISTATIGAAPVTCVLAVTDDPDALAATAALTVTAALSATDAGDTLAATAAALLAANLAVSDAADALASDADVLVVAALGVTDQADTLESIAFTEPLPEVVVNLAVTDDPDTLASVATIESDRRGHGGRNAGRMRFRDYDDFFAPPMQARLQVQDDDDVLVSRVRVSWVQRVVRARIVDADDVVQASAAVVPWPALELVRTGPSLQRVGAWRPISRARQR